MIETILANPILLALAALVGMAIVFGGLTVGSLSDRIGRRRMMILAFVGWAAASLVFLIGSLPLSLVAAVVIGIMFSGIPATIVAHVVTYTDERSFGPVFSATTLAFGLAQAVSPQIGGAIADWRGSFTSVFVLAAVVALLGSVASWFLPADDQLRVDTRADR